VELERRRRLAAASRWSGPVPVIEEPMIDGEMQAFALTLDKFLTHAAKWRPNAQVVTARDGGGTDRVGYAALMARSLRVSAVLQGLGVKTGDRVATLAWNTQAHVEVWYAIMGMGAVCHTLNPRLDVLGFLIGRYDYHLSGPLPFRPAPCAGPGHEQRDQPLPHRGARRARAPLSRGARRGDLV